MALDKAYVPRYLRLSLEDFNSGKMRGYLMNLSDECYRCDRRLWFRDVIMDETGTHLDYCKDCIAHMQTAYKVGRRLGSTRPWSNPPLIERHIRTFLDPTENPEAVRRRRFEAAWVLILDGAKSVFQGTSRRLTITDLDWVQQEGHRETVGRHEIWFGSGQRCVDNNDDGEAFIMRTLLEYVAKYL